MANPLSGKRLRYLIGANHPGDGKDNEITEPMYGLPKVARGVSIAYGNLFHELYSEQGPIYAPYLDDTDTSAEYGEGVIDPNGGGWERNLRDQFQRMQRDGFTVCELDNPDAYDCSDVLGAVELAQSYGLASVAKNPLITEEPNRYVAHPSIVGAIVEKGAGTPAEMESLRHTAGKPDLPVWFVFFGKNEDLAERTADQAAQFPNMFVTISTVGEYRNSVDVLASGSQPNPPEPEEPTMAIVISSGHGKYVPGAIGYLNEVDENRRVVDRVTEILAGAGVDVMKFHDDVSKTQNENLNRIVDFHNSKSRDLDVSVHFNSNATTSKPMGTECLYVTQAELADKVSLAIADAGDFPDRGGKKRTDLFFLNNTEEPAILIEVCFVDSSADAEAYNRNFEELCAAIATTISGQAIAPQPPVDGEKPMLRKGDEGPYVEELQTSLNRELAGCHLDVDGDFGSATDAAVRDYQRSRGLDVDGIVGPATWNALDTHAPVYVPPGLPPPLSTADQQAIVSVAMGSDIASYSWRDRGRAPAGYVKGFALAWANTCRQFQVGYPPAVEMAKANTGNADKDVLAWYASEFAAAGMRNDQDGLDTLRHLWALLMGLGMRESSGKHCEGRDMSASNVTSDTAEAGLYQTSYNAHNCSYHFDTLFDAFSVGGDSDNPQGFVEYFEDGVSCSSSSWANYGSGDGEEFQEMCKNQPAFACETCAIVLRNLRQHYGPINRREAELKRDADDMLRAVQELVARIEV